MNDVIQGRPDGRTIPEESPVKSNGRNGIVERSVGEVECQMRSLLWGFESRMGRTTDARERIINFLPEYAAYLLNRLHQGDDGKVPYERMKGKKPTILGIEFAGGDGDVQVESRPQEGRIEYQMGEWGISRDQKV